MKKRIILILIVLTVVLTLLGCEKQVVEITRFEEEKELLGGDSINAPCKSYERFLELYSYYYYDNPMVERVYLPRQGDFVNSLGEPFSATVEDIKFVYNYHPNYRTIIRFTLRIYSPDGEFLLEERINSRLERLNEPVSEAMAPYWDAVKILPEDLFQRTK